MTVEKYFMIKSPRKNVADPAGVEPATSWSPVGRASNWATKAVTSRNIPIRTVNIYEAHKHVQTLPKIIQEVTKVVSLVKMAEKLHQLHTVPLKNIFVSFMR